VIKKVKKRDGTYEPFNADKLNRWAEWAADLNVEWSSIALEAYKKCYDGCTTSELQSAMISACIDREDTAHLKMAGRLYAGDVYKNAFGDHDKIPSLKEIYYGMSVKGLWANMNYSDAELDELDSVLDHSLDLSCVHSEIKQIATKYSISNKISGKIYESPQFTYMRVALGTMNIQPAERRIKDVKKVYYLLSNKILNPPSPVMLHIGTMHLGLASCCVYTSGDNLLSLAVGDHIAYMMTAASAGIGSHLMTRSVLDPVRKGTIKHQGKLPYYRVIEKSVLANMQGGRGGSATVHYTVLDPEIEDLLHLRNPTTVAEKKIRDIDYSVGYNPFFASKVARNQNWMSVSYYHAPDLWHAMYAADQAEFELLYAKYEADKSVPKKFFSARKLAKRFLTEAVETGRLYVHNTHEMNRHTPFWDIIWSSNLCQEIGLPTKSFTDMMDLYSKESQGEIGLCNLLAIVAGRVTPDTYQDAAYYGLLMVDNVIEIMEYPFPSLKTSAQARRSVGIGITNLAYDLANRGLPYDCQAAKDYSHRLAEMHSYWLHEASLRLAKEKGLAPWMHKTKYPDGWLPVDTYNRNVDNITSQKNMFDWEDLRLRIKANGGIRNSVLEAYMPCESSSIASNTTNGLYPIRESVVIKVNGTEKSVFIAPDWEDLQHTYQSAWIVPTFDLIDHYAIYQKWCGQGISADLYVSYSDNANRKVGIKKLLKEWLYATKMGMKTRYYLNSATGTKVEEERGCASGSCSV